MSKGKYEKSQSQQNKAEEHVAPSAQQEAQKPEELFKEGSKEVAKETQKESGEAMTLEHSLLLQGQKMQRSKRSLMS